MILIIGATGMVGGEIVRLLTAAGKPVRAMVRATSDPAKVAALKNLGANLVEGDLRDARSLCATCNGVDTVITTASSMPFSYKPGENSPSITDRDGYLSLIGAAKDEGVQQFIYTSFAPQSASFPPAGR